MLKNQKFQNVQALRGIAVMLIVLVHVALTEVKYGHGIVLLPHLIYFGISGVDIFFIISGFIMATITQGQFQNKQLLLNFLSNRIIRIYPLYWLYSFLVLAMLVTASYKINQLAHPIEIIKSFLLIPQNHFPVLIVVGWSLIHELYFYLIIGFILFFPEKFFLRIILLWAFLILIGNLCFTWQAATTKLIMHPLSFEFIGGCIIGHLIHWKIPITTNKPMLSLGLLLFFVAILIYSLYYPNQLPDGWTRIILIGVPSFFTVYAIIAMEQQGYILFAFLQKLGDASYSIYLSHVLVLTALGKIWLMLPGKSYFFHCIILLIMIITVVIIGQLSFWYIEKPLILFFRQKKMNTNALPAQT